MSHLNGIPELSIIIPTFNEVDTVGGLLHMLSGQQGAVFEVVFCDGGSEDGTVDKVRHLATVYNFPVLILQSGKGRARQMNAGVRGAAGRYLLFLHADSIFADSLALRRGLDALMHADNDGDCFVAGHFALRFRRTNSSRSFFYYFSECKARLDREGCTHGDQGFMVSRKLFTETGPFDESRNVLEDTRFAETVRARGRWLLFPSELYTSARRFETEGEAARQFLNAIVITLDYMGREDMVRELPGIYDCRKTSERIRLMPFLGRMGELIKALPRSERIKFWSDMGRYVCGNAWQIPFAADSHRNFRNGVSPGEGRFHWLPVYDRYLGDFTGRRTFALIVGLLLRMIFSCTRILSGAGEVSLGRGGGRDG